MGSYSWTDRFGNGMSGWTRSFWNKNRMGPQGQVSFNWQHSDNDWNNWMTNGWNGNWMNGNRWYGDSWNGNSFWGQPRWMRQSRMYRYGNDWNYPQRRSYQYSLEW